jgi:hypothetical protein
LVEEKGVNFMKYRQETTTGIDKPEIQKTLTGTQEYLDIILFLKNIQYDLNKLDMKIKNIEERQEAIWKDVNLILSRPIKEVL